MSDVSKLKLWVLCHLDESENVYFPVLSDHQLSSSDTVSAAESFRNKEVLGEDVARWGPFDIDWEKAKETKTMTIVMHTFYVSAKRSEEEAYFVFDKVSSLNDDLRSLLPLKKSYGNTKDYIDTVFSGSFSEALLRQYESSFLRKSTTSKSDRILSPGL